MVLGDESPASFLKRDDARASEGKGATLNPVVTPCPIPRAKIIKIILLRPNNGVEIKKSAVAGDARRRGADKKAELLLSQSGRGRNKKDKGASGWHPGNERYAKSGVTLNRVISPILVF